MVEINTERIKLRPFILDDLDDISGYMDDEEVGKFFPEIPYPYTQDDAKHFLEVLCAEQGRREWALEVDGQVIGGINFSRLNKPAGTAEVGYLISREHWRKGFGSEALRAMLEHGFHVLNLRRIGAAVAHKNVASIALLEKFGFRQEGRRRAFWLTRGVLYDRLDFGLLREEWETFKSNA